MCVRAGKGMREQQGCGHTGPSTLEDMWLWRGGSSMGTDTHTLGGQQLALWHVALGVCHTLEEEPTPCSAGRGADWHGGQCSRGEGATVWEGAGILSQPHHIVNLPMTTGCAGL